MSRDDKKRKRKLESQPAILMVPFVREPQETSGNDAFELLRMASFHWPRIPQEIGLWNFIAWMNFAEYWVKC